MTHVAFRWTPAALLLMLAPPWLAFVENVHAEQFESMTAAARDLAPRIAQVIRTEQQKKGDVLEIAVFPFGDEKGMISEQLFLASKVLQGELATQLRNNSNRQFIVWDPFRAREQVRKSKVNTKLLRIDSWKEAAVELEKLGLDAAVIGSFQSNGKAVARGAVNVHTDILFAAGAPMQAASRKKVPADANQIVPRESLPMISTRFSVDILVDGEPLEMFAEKKGYHTGNFYLDIDRKKHYGKPFTIRLRNNGMPPVGWIEKTERLERARFFCAAVFVDGVNSFYEREADGKFYPSQRHPDNVTKWVLTAPGVRILPGYDSVENLNAQQWIGGDAQSVVNVKGFQLDGKTAAQFEFADAGESLAHEVGLTKDIGVISVYFYAEKSSGDMKWFPPGVQGAAAGVRQGKTIPNKVFEVNIQTHPKPVEVWNIYYRYSDSDDAIANRRKKGHEIIPVARAAADMKQRIARDRQRYRADQFRQRRLIERAMRGGGFPGRGGRVGSAGPRNR